MATLMQNIKKAHILHYLIDKKIMLPEDQNKRLIGTNFIITNSDCMNYYPSLQKVNDKFRKFPNNYRVSYIMLDHCIHRSNVKNTKATMAFFVMFQFFRDLDEDVCKMNLNQKVIHHKYPNVARYYGDFMEKYIKFIVYYSNWSDKMKYDVNLVCKMLKFQYLDLISNAYITEIKEINENKRKIQYTSFDDSNTHNFNNLNNHSIKRRKIISTSSDNFGNSTEKVVNVVNEEDITKSFVEDDDKKNVYYMLISFVLMVILSIVCFAIFTLFLYTL